MMGLILTASGYLVVFDQTKQYTWKGKSFVSSLTKNIPDL